jgi:hypothetical protein
LSTPRATILIDRRATAAAARLLHPTARFQTSRSSSVKRITGMALGWIGSTTAFGDVARNP